MEFLPRLGKVGEWGMEHSLRIELSPDVGAPKPARSGEWASLAEFLRYAADDLHNHRLSEAQLEGIAAAAARLAREAQCQADVQRARAREGAEARRLLGTLKQRFSKTLDFLEVPGWQAWSVRSPVPGDPRQLADALQKLEQELIAYESLEGQQPRTHTERIRKNQHLDEHARAILALAGELGACLTPEGAPQGGRPLREVHEGLPAVGTTGSPPDSVAGEERPPEAPPTVAMAPLVLQPVSDEAPAPLPEESESAPPPSGETRPPDAHAGLQGESGVGRILADMLAHDEIGRAYWLAHVAPRLGAGPLPPDWLLRAILLADFVTPLGDDATADDWYQLAQEHPQAWQDAQRLCGDRVAGYLIAAAALQPAMVAPQTGAVTWLQWVHRDAPEMGPQMGTIAGFASTGQRIAPVSEADDPVRMLAQLRKSAQHWIQVMRSAGAPFKAGARLMRHLSSPESPTGRLADWIVHDQRKNVAQARAILESLETRRDIEALFEGAWGHRAGTGRRCLVEGRVRDTLITRVEHLRDVGHEWTRIAGQSERTGSRSAAAERLREVRRALHELRSHLAVVASNADAAGGLIEAAAAGLLERRADRLIAFLDGKRELAAPRDGSWIHALQRPLLSVSPCPLPDSTALPGVSDPAMAKAIWDRLEHPLPLEEAFETHLRAGDLMAANRVREALEEDGASVGNLTERIAAAHAALAEELQQAIDKLLERVEKETIDHVLSEGERATIVHRFPSPAGGIPTPGWA